MQLEPMDLATRPAELVLIERSHPATRRLAPLADQLVIDGATAAPHT